MNIIISPLDWGLGHTVRIIPIIRFLKNNNHNIYIAGNLMSISILKKEFPELNYLYLKPYNIKYSNKINNSFIIFLQAYKIIFTSIYEYFKLKKYIKKFKIDIVISDNRYGFFSKKIYSIFITHQISPKTPFKNKFPNKILYKIHKIFIEKFDKCMIPDFENEEINLTGDLSHKFPLPKNAKFIGILSDFEPTEIEPEIIYDIAIIISGPEPQRSIFEQKLKSSIDFLKYKTIIITGKPENKIEKNEFENYTEINHLERKEMRKIILQSKTIICRAGYTSIMDLVRLNKNAILIPTPGQTEQEYLAEYLSRKIGFLCISQKNINKENITKLIKKSLISKELKFPFVNSTDFTNLNFN
jgi:uncharacterized protein (TIGR00661 family)